MLKEGTYNYQITEVKETTAQTRYGDIPAVDIYTTVAGGETAKVRLWLNDARANQAKVQSFLSSMGMIADDGTVLLTDWTTLTGKYGRARFAPKKLSGGGWVIDVTDFAPSSGTPVQAPAPAPKATPAPKPTPAPTPELEPVTDPALIQLLSDAAAEIDAEEQPQKHPQKIVIPEQYDVVDELVAAADYEGICAIPDPDPVEEVMDVLGKYTKLTSDKRIIIKHMVLSLLR